MKKQEFNLQVSIINLLRKYNIYCFSVPNGGSRNLLEAYNLKRSGVLAGASDIIIVLNKQVIFVELKTEKGKQSPSQKEFQTHIETLGHKYLIWKSIDDCLNFIKIYKS